MLSLSSKMWLDYFFLSFFSFNYLEHSLLVLFDERNDLCLVCKINSKWNRVLPFNWFMDMPNKWRIVIDMTRKPKWLFHSLFEVAHSFILYCLKWYKS